MDNALTPAELAEATAREVMGWHLDKFWHWTTSSGEAVGYWLPSRNLVPAWNPAEDWRSLEVLLARLTKPRTDPEDRTRGYTVSTSSTLGDHRVVLFRYECQSTPIATADAHALPIAVCTAALQAVRGERC